ncbi:MAG: uroporphyrinogen-III C-methyltransferase [Pigmentiphaga sp.]|nr:uroporphyrinogen-III C-methyltransferase [Pigmentiphaga sp.]
MGKVYLVGAGPGAADLLTWRAVKLLQQADCVFFDALVGPEILELAAQAKRVPVGKRCGQRSTAQQFINKQLVEAAQRYRLVVRLKGGDPMLFGRAQEELDALNQANIPVEVVPGISAAFGAAAALQQSLTQRGISRNVTFLTPSTGEGQATTQWRKAAAAADTAVIYMGGQQLPSIQQGLLEEGVRADCPVVLIENASLPTQRIMATRLGQLGGFLPLLGNGPVLIMLGEVCEATLSRLTNTPPQSAAA